MLISVYHIGNCYEKVKLETKEMQEAIQKELGLSPVEENVIVLYSGEKESRTDDFWKVLKVYALSTQFSFVYTNIDLIYL